MCTMQRISLLFPFLIVMLSSCTTANVNSNRLGEEISKYFNYQEIVDNPGASIFVSLDGEPIFQKTFGMANIDKSIKVSPETTFRIGSITKQFTATAILLLKERGLLTLNDTLDQFILDFPQAELVTIYHLLTHTSGIISYTDDRDFGEYVTNYIEKSDLIDQIKDLGYYFQPGERWLYNNSGYFLLGHIIEIVSGLSYEEFLNENIFIPLAVCRTLPLSKKKNFQNSISRIKFLHECKFYKY